MAGDHNLVVNEGTEQTVGIDEIIMHPDYSEANYDDNDICILKLASSLEMNEYVKAITLPSEPHQEFEGIASVSGWGSQKHKGPLSDTLHALKMPIVSDATCSVIYGQYETVTESMLCAGAGGTGPCDCDDGDPLICEGGIYCGQLSRYLCGFENYPNIFTQISYYLDFIKANS